LKRSGLLLLLLLLLLMMMMMMMMIMMAGAAESCRFPLHTQQAALRQSSSAVIASSESRRDCAQACVRDLREARPQQPKTGDIVLSQHP
jgi:hypothetical protein